MTSERNQVFLGALLHDIGKFYQRADAQGMKKSKFLTDEVKRLESVLCPVLKSHYTHKHVLYTAQFFVDFEPHLKKLLVKDTTASFDKLLRMAAAHHRPESESLIERLIQKADHYASGIDRSNSEVSWKDAQDESDEAWDSFKRIKMRSVFEGIELKGDAPERTRREYTHQLPLEVLSLSRNHFPSKKSDNVPEYDRLWEAFIGEIKFIQTDSIRTFANTLTYLLEKYASRIPASTQHLPDVSLFDHSKMVAALAISLFDFCKDRSFEVIPGKDEKPYLLVGGDLSGIQRFIYGIIARGAAKNLKGRSFYIELLMNNVVHTLLEELDLFDANVVYSSGGKFYLIAPNTNNVLDRLATVERMVVDRLFEYHGTDLFLAIDAIPFGERDLLVDRDGSSGSADLGVLWAELNERLSIKKHRRFRDKLKPEYKRFFEPSDAGGLSLRDSITGEEIAPGKEVAISDDESESSEKRYISKYTQQQIKLGQKLREVDYWIVSRMELTYFGETAFEPIGMGTYNYFVTKSDLQKKEIELRASADRVRVLAINQPDFLEPVQKGIDNVYGFHLYGGNDFPVSKYRVPKTFEELAGVEFEDSEQEVVSSKPGLVRLGVLRMDVDNLGSIFKQGLAEDKRSFSRYATLSRSLDYFFKGYLNTIWKDKLFRDHSQIIYAGGDDVFIVGKWDVLMAFARKVQEDFADWTCHNVDLTISGGIVMVPPKFPLLKAALLCEEEESRAKNHIFKERSKNAFSVFGFAFNWGFEYAFLVNLKEEICRYMEQGKLSRGFASEMYTMMESASFFFDNEKMAYRIRNVQVIWMLAYQFKRACIGKDEEVSDFFYLWITKILTGRIEDLRESKYHPLQFLAIAARWAQIQTRS